MDDAGLPAAPTAIVSADGAVVLPEATRVRLRWPEGTRLVVVERPEGVLLSEETVRKDALFRPTRLEDVVGMLKSDGPVLTVEDMDAAVLEMFSRRDRG